MIDITLEGVTRILVSEIEEYELDDEDDEDEEPFSRTITIELASGETIELDLNAATRDELEILDDD
jgi:hypothetical protein